MSQNLLQSYDLQKVKSLEAKIADLERKQNENQAFVKPVVAATYRKSDQMVPLLPGKLELNLQSDFSLKPYSPPCRKHDEQNREG